MTIRKVTYSHYVMGLKTPNDGFLINLAINGGVTKIPLLLGFSPFR